MDKATVIGLVLGVGLVLGSIAIGGGGLMPFVDVPSLMITVGGSIAAILINFPMGKVLSVFSVFKNCFLWSLPTPPEVIEQFKKFATTARRDGLLALENDMGEVDDTFLKRGLELVVGGSSREELVANLETEVAYVEQRHQTGKKIVDAIAAAAPAFGMIGTLIGLVQMLRSLDDPSQIGGGMAVALLTTLYGAVISNLFCIPLAGKLESRSQEEMMIRELMISGLVSLIEGHAPRAVEEKLLAFLSPKNRNNGEAKAQAA
ncbi:MAG: MotA/TolQ/ExbB proton channel family protein [Planctomycetaceae bacterium]|nr:MotA/TolQ/ExbB proton channel family protein [Planctomycetaceae bacterium]